MTDPFRSSFACDMFGNKYRHERCETWPALAHTVVEDVCRDYMPQDDKDELEQIIAEMLGIPGGRYLYYAGRPLKAFNNCYLLRALTDTREDWADLSWKAESCLATGGGIGVDYSVYRHKGAPLKRTGGVASGPVSKMRMINEIGREVMQGGSRRSAIYASLNWQHPDAREFLHEKDWHNTVIPGTSIRLSDVKAADFNWPAPLDMTNGSLNYDDVWLDDRMNELFIEHCRQALQTGELGWSFNFLAKARETLRNACTEVTSEDDSDVCNLASANMSRIKTIEQWRRVCYLLSQFLLCGTLVADLPYEKVRQVREKNRRLGLGIMGVHEWLLVRGYRYECVPELHDWLAAYRDESERGANDLADRLSINRPVAYRAIAPTGTIGLIAGTTTGIEPIYATGLKRRYLKNGTEWHYQYIVDSTAKLLVDMHGLDPGKIETAVDLAGDYERRIKFQADVQDYVDMGISSTLNLPAEGTIDVKEFATTLARYAPRLRGLTVYPDGARGGQPLTSVPYREAEAALGVEYAEHDSCKGGVCGI